MSTSQSVNYYLYDARSEKTYGPLMMSRAEQMSRAEAEQMASALNAFVYRNGIGAALGIPANKVEITGPFYVREQKVSK